MNKYLLSDHAQIQEQQNNVQIPDDPSIVQPIFNQLKSNFLNKKTLDLKFRRQQLKKLIYGHKKLKSKFDDAMKKDLGYNQFMSSLLSHKPTQNQMEHILKNFQTWSQSQSIQTTMAMGIATTKVKPEPLGLILVIAAWNYPIYTALPFVAVAIAAGNSVILKPSEVAPYSSNVLKELFDTYLDKNYYQVIQGKVQVAIKLTSLRFDSILFTGSTVTGRAVATAAAKNLIPCVLQLGGKCPVIVDETTDLQSAGNRILWGKFTNCGQTCIAGDHIIVKKQVKQKLIKIFLRKIEEMYGKNKQSNEDMGKIINLMHLRRIQSYLKDDHKGKIIYGGKIHQKNLFIQPTIVDQPSLQSKLMTQEIFGPILPIITYNNNEELVKHINSQPKPLVVYCFSQNKSTINKIQSQTSSGAFIVNDLLIHMTNTQLPFGGVGLSGYGRYHGKCGFDACSNLKSIMYAKTGDMFPLNSRFPPYTQNKKKLLSNLLQMGNTSYQQIFKSCFFITHLGFFSYNMQKLENKLKGNWSQPQ